MRSGGRRLLRRPQRRRRLLTIVAAVILILLLFLVLAPSITPPDGTTETVQRPWQTLKPPLVTATLAAGDGAAAAGATPMTSRSPVGNGAEKERDHTTPLEVRTDGLHYHYSKELTALAALDLFPLRPGESRVSFEDFTGCLGAMLAVDPVAQTETPRTNPANTQELPLLISVTAGNTQDLKAMICNLSVPYKYIVLSQTGDTPEMTPFFDLLRRVFRFTTRLVVLQFKESIGYAGAVNAALREALRHPFDEVPFVHIVHNDVRYGQVALANSIRTTYLEVANDKAVIAKLEAEVLTEPNDFTPLIRQPQGLRAPISPDEPLPQLRGKSSVLVTSALLPDRLRYMAENERRTYFQHHFSFFFHNSRGQYTGVYLSRLAVLTVGFFDENFYPIMFDDTDFRWRASMLGFNEVLLDSFDASTVAFDLDCTNVKVGGDDGPHPPPHAMPGVRGQTVRGMRSNNGNPNDAKPRLSPATVALLRECATAFERMVQFNYMAAKWSVTDFLELAQPATDHQPYALEAFSGKGHLPLDAWVVDTHRIDAVKKSLRDTGVGGLEIEPYNPEVILAAVP